MLLYGELTHTTETIMSRNLEFYKTSSEGAVALTELARDHPKARLLVDWVAMILTNRGSTCNAVMVDSKVLQSVLRCSVNTVTRAVKAASDAKVIGVGRIGNNRVYYLNPKAIKMDNVDDKYYAMDVAVIFNDTDSIYQSIRAHKDEVNTFGISRNGSGLIGGKGSGLK